jgi:hypothetical protein
MNLARGLERRLENLVDGASASVFKGRMHPVDIGGKVLRQLDFLAVETDIGPAVPNRLLVTMNPADIDPAADLGNLITELEGVVTVSARENGWRLVGPVEIEVRTDTSIPKGVLGCEGTNAPGTLPVWAQLIATDGSAVLNISRNRTLIGRDLDCDIRLANEEISRHHAVVYIEGVTPRIQDVGSSNGTFVNHAPARKKPIQLAPGDGVVLGNLSFTYRPVG